MESILVEQKSTPMNLYRENVFLTKNANSPIFLGGDFDDGKNSFCVRKRNYSFIVLRILACIENKIIKQDNQVKILGLAIFIGPNLPKDCLQLYFVNTQFLFSISTEHWCFQFLLRTGLKVMENSESLYFGGIEKVIRYIF